MKSKDCGTQSLLWQWNQSEHRVHRPQPHIQWELCRNPVTCVQGQTVKSSQPQFTTLRDLSCISRTKFRPLVNLWLCRKQLPPFLLRCHRQTKAPDERWVAYTFFWVTLVQRDMLMRCWKANGGAVRWHGVVIVFLIHNLDRRIHLLTTGTQWVNELV